MNTSSTIVAPRPRTTKPLAAWQPILEGDQRLQALATIRAIADALVRVTRTSELNGTLSVGEAGIALFFDAAARLFPNAGYDALAEACIQRAADCMAGMPMSPSLYSGFPGIAWTIAQTAGEVVPHDDDALSPIDEVLAELTSTSPWEGEYDLIAGLVGIGVYALERLPATQARICLEQVVERIEELAIADGEGLTWASPLSPFETAESGLSPESFNLGLAHGMPAVIGLLAQAISAGVAIERARPLLDGAVHWLLAQELPADKPGRFAYTAGPDQPQTIARLAWCYSEAGNAATLLGAARRVGRKDWEDAACRLARAAAGRPDELSGVRDAGLCHGAAGLGHLFNRVYQATGDETLAVASRHWYRRALAMRYPSRPLAGYASFHFGQDGQTYELDDPGFLEGVAGIGLALTAAISHVEPRWDQLLLTSIPSVPTA